MKKRYSLILFVLILAVGLAVQAPATLAATTQTPPYPASSVIAGITFDFSTVATRATGSDIWPTTWASDGNIYSSWGDGGGFGGSNTEGRVSLGFARITGSPTSFTGYNVWGGKNPEHKATFGGKTAGMISVGGTLYAWLNTQNATPPDTKLAWSTDLGASWQTSSWVFPGSGSFFPSTFANFGQNNAGARDGYVYSYGARWTETQGQENNVYMMRVPAGSLKDRTAYDFLSGFDLSGNPTWSKDVNARKPMFTDPNGVGNTALANVIYDPALGRYILTVGHRPPGSTLPSGTRGRLGIFDAPQPWGPWTTVAYYDNWGGYGDGGETLGYQMPTKWISSDGKTIWFVYSSTDVLDSFNLVKATLTLKTATVSPTATPSATPAPTSAPTPVPPSSAAAIHVNFQTPTSAAPSGYLADAGLVYGPRGNGYTYGWNLDNSVNTRERNASNSPDKRYDTFVHMQRNGTFIWEIAVPNGKYSVHIVSGDALYYDSVFQTSAEGTLVVNGTPTSANRWVEGTATVSVSDGKLTIANASGASNNKIDFIDITPVP